MQCAIIDQCIGWYGRVNLMGRSLADTNVIRMASSDLANALMDETPPTGGSQIGSMIRDVS